MKSDLRHFFICLAIFALAIITATGCGSVNDDSAEGDGFPCKTEVCGEGGCGFEDSADWTRKTTPQGVCLGGTLYPNCGGDDAECRNGFDCVKVERCDDTTCSSMLLCAPDCNEADDCTFAYVEVCNFAKLDALCVDRVAR